MRTIRELRVIVVSDAARTLCAMQEENQSRSDGDPDMPLPATLTFVLIIGVTFLVLWFGLFMLLKERW